MTGKERSTVPTMLTVQQVADHLHVHPQTVRTWIRSGELGHHDVGRYDLVSEDQLTDFLDARRAD